MKLKCKFIYDFASGQFWWICPKCYTRVLNNDKDKIIICPKCKSIVKRKETP